MMARTRMIKPGFFRSRSLSKVSRDARLTFIGMWMEADSAGRGIADARLIHGAIWPLEDDISPLEVEQHIEALEMTGHIRLYAVGDETYYVIVNFEKHQSAAYRTGATQFPEPTEREDVHDAQETVQVAQEIVPIYEGKGREYISRESNQRDPSPRPRSNAPQAVRDSDARLPSEPPSPPEKPARAPAKKPLRAKAQDDEFARWWAAYPRKENRKSARQAFEKAHKQVSTEVLIAALAPMQAKAEDPSQRQFIPYPTTWLNGERWLDEPPNGHANGLLPGQRMRDGIVLETRQ